MGRIGKTLVSVATVCLLAAATMSGQADHGAQYSQADIAAGYRVFSSQCTQCHGANGDGVSGVDLRRGVFRRAVSDEDLGRVITQGVPGAGMPPFALQPAELTGVVAFIRAGFDQTVSVKVGDAARGRAVFEGKGQCLTCHQVQGRGSRLGPDLTDIGRLRRVAELERALLEPGGDVLPQNRTVRAVTRDGTTVTGRLLNHDTFTLLMLDSNERLRSFAKADLREFSILKTSSKTSYRGTLSAQEISDLLGYLVSLRGAQAASR